MEKKICQFRQGDVLLEKVDSLPTTATPVGHNTVAKGEKSNHHHLATGDTLLYEDTKTGTSYLVVNTEGKLEHINVITNLMAEHNPIVLEKGVYEVVHQREYNPYTKLAQRVRD